MSASVVYTAISGQYDRLKAPPVHLVREDVEFVAFLSEQQPAPPWRIRKICSEFADPCRNAKVHKILSHLFFPDKEYSLWIDGSVQIGSNFPLQTLIDDYLREHDLAVFQHRVRHCVYEEAEACISQQKDDPEIIRKQMDCYRENHYPANNGLAECTVLLRRHTRQVREFNEAWYEEIQRHSRRDQLSFNYAAHKLGFAFCHFPGRLRQKSNEWFRIHRHETDHRSSGENKIRCPHNAGDGPTCMTR